MSTDLILKEIPKPHIFDDFYVQVQTLLYFFKFGDLKNIFLNYNDFIRALNKLKGGDDIILKVKIACTQLALIVAFINTPDFSNKFSDKEIQHIWATFRDAFKDYYPFAIDEFRYKYISFYTTLILENFQNDTIFNLVKELDLPYYVTKVETNTPLL